ncbi:MAG TPA: ABC transporter substrate-binding protein [Propionicimonas sp.]|nr:ABC transporter substrate-binding protein [Propionicimonas sp.]HQA77500.1 ABC transporter substrate-binding protein [Propionicimonas sp.]HQD97321.1 ABC transporter substrate-binding protein [Propionicimonas sp.]
MKRTQIVAGVATTLALGLALTACGSSPTATSTAGGATSGAAAGGAAGGTLHILSGTATEHWDPQRVYVGVNIEYGNRMFTRTLTTFGPVAKDGEPATLIADAATDTGTVSADGKEWKFTIKDGVKWEDGQAVKCEDFKYGISRTFAVDVITGGPNYAIQYLDIPKNDDGSSKYAGPYKKTGQDLYDKAVTCDGNTITFKMAKPSGDFNMAATMTAFGAFREDKDQGEKSNYAIFSNGPYKLEGSWTANKGATFVRNENWDPATDGFRKAYPDKIVWDESLTQETMYERIIADQGDDKNAIAMDQAPVTAMANVTSAEGRYTVVASPYTRYMVPNYKSKVFSNDKAREALALATDRSAYVTAAGGDQVVKATNSLINPALPAFPNTPLLAGEKGDAAKAKEALQASGLTLPVKINVAYRKNDTLDKAFAGLKAGWDAAGFQTNLIGIPAEQYYGTLQSPESATKYDAYWAGWGADFPSASTVIPQLLDSRSQISAGGPGQDYGYFDNDEFNAGIDKAMALTGAEGDKAWGALDTEVVTKHFGVIPLINDQFVFAHGSNVEGAVVNTTFTGYYDIANVSVKK